MSPPVEAVLSLPGARTAADASADAGTAELQGIATLEVTATGKPVVAADAGALPLLVRDGWNGRPSKPGDVGGLAARLTGILSGEKRREEMGEESLGLAARHAIGETLDAFEETYAMVTRPTHTPENPASPRAWVAQSTV